ncbi:MAG: hypothetical protein R3Y35_01350 [Clostridia bacterium]
MKNYIYIRNDGIQLVTVKGKIFTTQTEPLTAGTILNGVILNTAELTVALRKITANIGSATLVVDSSNIITNKITIPNVSEKKLNEILKGEFDLYNKEETYLFDTDIINKTNSEMTVLCFAISHAFIETYTKLFAEVKVKIDRIEVAVNGAVKYIRSKKDLEHETFVFNIVSGDNMLSLLFENGQYKLANRSRLLNKAFPEQYAQELYSRVSSVIQLAQAEKTEYVVNKSYYVGLTEQELLTLGNYVEEIGGAIAIEAFSDTKIDINYIFPYSATITNKRDVDFNKNKQAKYSKAKQNQTRAMRVAMVILLFGALVFYAGDLYIDQIQINVENDKLEDYIYSTEVITQVSEYNELTAQNTLISSEKNVLVGLVEDVTVSKILSTETLGTTFEQIINSLSYNYSGNSLVISGQTYSEQDIVDFVALLRQDETIETLTYTGYTLDVSDYTVTTETVADDGSTSSSSTTTTDNVYTFSINATLSAIEDSEVTND